MFRVRKANLPNNKKGRLQAALDTLYRGWLCFLIFKEKREGTPRRTRGVSSPQEERPGRHSS
jgi:hypothetical protein